VQSLNRRREPGTFDSDFFLLGGGVGGANLPSLVVEKKVIPKINKASLF
jgi:hypothetical protein